MPVRDQLRFGARAMRELLQASSATRRNAVRHAPRPPRDGLVADIGSGQQADPRADVIVDKYVLDDFERSTERSLDLSRPLVVADAHALPFTDQSFAYVIASHVLEHATDPVKFAAELGRVAHAGFVQVPSREAELTFGWDFHPWLIDRDADTLVFHPRGAAAAPVGSLFHEAMSESALFALWFGSHRDRWHHSIEWRGRLAVRVMGGSHAPKTAQLDLPATIDALATLSRQGAVRGPMGAVRECLRCPVDHGTLEITGERAACKQCGRDYPIAGGVPILIEEAAGVAV
jgi:SAM-dependent methyltransferase